MRAKGKTMAKKRVGITTTGKDFKAFYLDWKWPWGDPDYEDTVIKIDHVDSEDLNIKSFREVSDDATVYFEGEVHFDNCRMTFPGMFRRWQKEQSTTTFLVECDKANADKVKAAVVAASGKVK